MKDKRILYGTIIAFLLLAVIGFSYAYFSSSISGNNDSKDMVVEAGTLKLTYTDSKEIVMENIKPGGSITKEVTVENTGTLETEYNIIWQELTNEIINDEMLISATCKRLNGDVEEGTCEGIEETVIGPNRVKSNITIESGITHKYTFTFTFKETGEIQNYNQGKKFNGMLGIEEYKKPNFATDSWSDIVANVKAGNGSDYTVGDTKEVDLGEYGTHTLRIANTSTPDECNTAGFSQTACGFVLEFADIITSHQMNPAGEYNGTTYNYGYNVGGWPNTTMRTFVNNEIYNALPTELKNGIIDTTVVSSYGNMIVENEEREDGNFVSIDKLYLFSPEEVWEDTETNSYKSYDTSIGTTRQLDYYKKIGVTTSNYSGAVKLNGTSASRWWLRSASSTYNLGFLAVHYYGYFQYSSYAYDRNGVAPGFRIG